jgi:hypothetical protein
LEDPSYIESLPDDHAAKANQNVFGFSLGVASLEVLQLIMLVVNPLGMGAVGAQNYHLLTGGIDLSTRGCDAECQSPDLAAAGDRREAGTGIHSAAEEARRRTLRRTSRTRQGT